MANKNNIHKHVKSGNYFTVCGWMLTDLCLKGNELLTYALIYGFSQEENCWCHATQEYIAEWIGCTTRTVRNSIEELISKNLLIKKEVVTATGIQNVYKALKEPNTDEENFSQGLGNNFPMGAENFSQGLGKTFPTGAENFSQHTIKDNINNNINNNIGDKSPAPASKTRFVKPTVEEIAAYCRERNNNVDAQYFFDYYEGNGWKRGKTPLKDWKATVRTWERNSYSNSGRSTCGNNNPAGFDEMFD